MVVYSRGQTVSILTGYVCSAVRRERITLWLTVIEETLTVAGVGVMSTTAPKLVKGEREQQKDGFAVEFVEFTAEELG